ncbi:MAG: BspA family leucine-rich repeat surface protein, partial [Arcobacteraceae bacterium]|nr:BspA family leucine-rich repeat surface protein [Arcobacteraceae bacterium]
MKRFKSLIVSFWILLTTSLMAAGEPMVLVYNTQATGASGLTVTLPLYIGSVNEMDVTVDWGDGSSSSYTSQGMKSHGYSSHGIYTVQLTGTLTQFGTYTPVTPSDIKKLIKVESFGDIGLRSLQGAFYNASNLTQVPAILPSTVTDLSSCFVANSSFNDANITSWDVSHVTTMANMFNATLIFNQDIGDWNVSNVTNMYQMFRNNQVFNQDIGDWNVSNVTNMSSMFSGASVFNQNIGRWDTSKVTNMQEMFNWAYEFNQDIGDWNVSNVVNMSSMFGGFLNSKTKFNYSLDKWDVGKVWNMSKMFYLSDFNSSIAHWNTANVTDMSSMFASNTKFDQNISRWNTSKVTTLNGMFNSTPFNQDIGDWNTSSVTNFGAMFYSATKFDQNISRWDTSKATTMSQMFNMASKFNQDIGDWNTNKVTDMSFMFNAASLFNQDIGRWNTNKVTTTRSMFANASKFNQDIGDWDTSKVTTMMNMFTGTSTFNQDISDWNISSITTMDMMFTGVTLSPSYYDAMLQKWSTQTVKPSVLFNAGNSKYSASAVTSRAILTGEPNNWTISDGGQIPNSIPTNIILSPSIISENSTAGTTIGTLSSTDADSSDTHTYSFCGGVNDNSFIITGTTLKSNSVFDYETKSSYSVCIRTTDSANAIYDKNVTISIINLNETPTITSNSVTSINEKSGYSYTLGASDIDGDTLTWSVKAGTTLPSWLSLSSDISVTTFAGDGTAGSTDGIGATAQFNSPSGVAVDSSGNVFVADYINHKIRKITPDGNVSTFAGSGTDGFADGTGTAAQFNYPYGVAVDSNGNVYVADVYNNKIRKITPDGNVSTFAGSGTDGFADGSSTTAQFNHPRGVAVDSNGNVYVADVYNNKIRKITPDGNVSTLAGSTSGFADGTGTAAKFNFPSGVAVDSNGNVYVADVDNNKIRKITPDGNVSTLAGSTSGFADGTGTAAKFNYPSGVAVDSNGNVFIADTNNRIRKIDNSTKLTGTPTNSDVGVYDINLTVSDGTTTVAHNFKITVNNVNDAVTDINLSSNTIAENSAGDITIGTLSSTDIDVGDTHTYSFCGGTDDANFSISGSELKANAVFDYEMKSSYSICVRTTDSGNATFDKNITLNVTNVNETPIIISNAITSINEKSGYSYTLGASDIDGDTLIWSGKAGTTFPSWLKLNSKIDVNVTTLAGSGISGFADGSSTTAQFQNLTGVAVDSSGNMYVADQANHRIRKIDTNGNVTTLAGSGISGFADGSSITAQFQNPLGVAVDSSGNVFAIDSNNHRIRKIDTNGNVTTLAGNGISGFADGSSTTAQFKHPNGIAVDNSGNVFVADELDHKIRKITPNGDVTTLAGSGISGFADGSSTTAQFNHPRGVAVDSSGNVFVADMNNQKIRKIDQNGNVTTLAGNGISGFADGSSTIAKFTNPAGVAVDSTGNVFVADITNQKIRKIGTNGDVTTVAGTTLGFADGSSTIAKFTNPAGVAVDSTGNVFVADFGNQRIRRITQAIPAKLTGTPPSPGVYDVNLTLSDGTNEVEHNFQITVNSVNHAPTNITLSKSTIAENSVIGTTIGTLSTVDVDVEDTHTYSFCGGVNDNNFTINGTTLKSSGVFDYETKSSYSVCVKTTDSGNATFDKNITITVTDVNESSSGTDTNTSIGGNSGGGSTPTPINGTCGTSNGIASLIAPSANLCSTGTASNVTTGSTNYTW